MKTSLDHLPERKREQLQAIAAAVQANVNVEMIILFGSYARGNWVEDHSTLYFSDFDLMVIVESPEVAQDQLLWQRITADLRLIAGHVPVTVLPHDIREVNHEIRIGQYFFADVASEGIALYDSLRFMLAKPRAHTAAERLELAVFNFRYWFQSAGGFWRGAGYYMAEGLGPHAAFLLHQATERYFHAVLLVYTGYKPRSHDIEALASQTAPLHEALQGALPRTEGEDIRLFGLLKRAYIDARYSKTYRITMDELAALRRHVLDLGERVRRACADQLATITEDGAIGELPELPTLNESIELPELPALDDRHAVEIWRDAIVQMSQERGEQRFREGRSEGKREGEAHGRQQERVSAILDVLQRRGIALSDEQVQRITTCRDDATLATWWERAWTVARGDELIATLARG